jgi:hypothetical protein
VQKNLDRADAEVLTKRDRARHEFLNENSSREFGVEGRQFNRALPYLIVSMARNIVTNKTPSCVLVKSMFDALMSAPLNQWNNKEKGKLSATRVLSVTAESMGSSDTVRPTYVIVVERRGARLLAGL